MPTTSEPENDGKEVKSTTAMILSLPQPRPSDPVMKQPEEKSTPTRWEPDEVRREQQKVSSNPNYPWALSGQAHPQPIHQYRGSGSTQDQAAAPQVYPSSTPSMSVNDPKKAPNRPSLVSSGGIEPTVDAQHNYPSTKSHSTLEDKANQVAFLQVLKLVKAQASLVGSSSDQYLSVLQKALLDPRLEEASKALLRNLHESAQDQPGKLAEPMVQAPKFYVGNQVEPRLCESTSTSRPNSTSSSRRASLSKGETDILDIFSDLVKDSDDEAFDPTPLSSSVDMSSINMASHNDPPPQGAAAERDKQKEYLSTLSSSVEQFFKSQQYPTSTPDSQPAAVSKELSTTDSQGFPDTAKKAAPGFNSLTFLSTQGSSQVRQPLKVYPFAAPATSSASPTSITRAGQASNMQPLAYPTATLPVAGFGAVPVKPESTPRPAVHTESLQNQQAQQALATITPYYASAKSVPHVSTQGITLGPDSRQTIPTGQLSKMPQIGSQPVASSHQPLSYTVSSTKHPSQQKPLQATFTAQPGWIPLHREDIMQTQPHPQDTLKLVEGFKSYTRHGVTTGTHNSNTPVLLQASASTFPVDRDRTAFELQGARVTTQPAASYADVSTLLINGAQISSAVPEKSSLTSGPKNVPHSAQCGRTSKPKQSKKVAVVGGGIRSPKSQQSDPNSPHVLGKMILAQRGYPTASVSSEISGYHVVPSPLQQASFGTEVVKAVQSSDAALLNSLLGCGLSPNPCNSFGDSIVHLVCKRADFEIFKCLVSHGCDVKVCDGFGRTPLHHAAWAGKFCEPLVGLLLQLDPFQLLVQDKHGQTPLEYVKKDQWPKWIQFLFRNKDTYWAVGIGERYTSFPTKPYQNYIPDPANAVSLDLARDIASGTVTPTIVSQMTLAEKRSYTRLDPADSSLQDLLRY